MGTVAIAAKLNINHSTVSGTKKSIYAKTGSENIVELKGLAELYGMC
jgi:DNA-binding CsgD family transcriptional regulator